MDLIELGKVCSVIAPNVSTNAQADMYVLICSASPEIKFFYSCSSDHNLKSMEMDPENMCSQISCVRVSVYVSVRVSAHV